MIVKLTKWVKELDDRIDNLSNELKGIREDTKPLLDTSKVFLDKVNSITDKLDGITGKVEGAVDSAKGIVDRGLEIADDVVMFEKKIKGSVEPQVLDTINTYAAIVKGVKVFFDRLKNGRGNHKPSSSNPALDLDFRAKVYGDEIQEEYDDIDRELNEVRKKLDEMKKH